MAEPDDSTSVFREHYLSRDVDEVEAFISRTYDKLWMQVPDGPDGFEFRNETVAVSTFSINRLRVTHGYTSDVVALGQLMIVSPRASSAVYDSRDYPRTVAADGGAVLAPVGCGMSAVVHAGADLDVVGLAFDAVGDYAEAVTGLPADRLRFAGLAPRSPALNDHLRARIAHVRGDILDDPEVAAVPLVLRQAQHMLAAALLSTFPNTALDAIDDPLAPGAGAVSAEAADRAVDFVRGHAADLIGPADVATLVGAPTGDIDAALRRRRSTTLARQRWAARLWGAHRDLEAGDPATDTVAAIAARWGFVSPATFALAYTRATRGETPEETLRR